ncbi:MAG: DUF2760 domain-containing protein, partial [Planctomycetales bacterium]
QREARFIDFLQESLAEYSAEQVKAAVLDVHRDCGAVIERLYDVRALCDQPEGEPIDVPEGYDSASFRLTGNVSGDPPHRGTLQHHGWKATKCDPPDWTGSEENALIIAAAEVELS